MKTVLILTASTGAGHNQAAQNLKVEFEKRNVHVEVVDMFKATSKSMNVILEDGYKLLATKLPKAYGVIYRGSDKRYFNRLFSSNFLIATELRIKKVIRKTKPALVISTHPFGAPVMGNLKSKGKVTVPFIQIVTDFKAHYTYVHPCVDAYITASEYTKQSLVMRGIAAHRVFAYGIPTKAVFQKMKPRLFSDDKPFELLVMGGSMGLKPMELSVMALLKSPDRLKLTVVCGQNDTLLSTLKSKCQDAIRSGHLNLLGYVDNIHELMEEADVIVTKPGGLTTTEAINKCIPMIIPFAIPGQEQENTSFLVEHQMAIEVNNIDELNAHIRALIDHPENYQQMVENMMALSKSYSLEHIISMSMQMIDKEQQSAPSNGKSRGIQRKSD